MTDARTITLALGGRWYGPYGMAFCPAHDNRHTPALSLADGEDGRLLVHCHAGCDFAAILDALKARGLVEGPSSFTAPDPFKAAEAERQRRKDADKRSRQALAIWREAGPIEGTAAETYLRHRAITCPLPDTLRFSAFCWHASGRRLPAMVALVEGAEGFAVHRTYLRPDGTGKAAVKPDKAMLGGCAGGAVRLTDGPDGLAVAEGIETALSLACGLLPGHPAIWAALSTSGMRSLRLSGQAGKLTIAPDGDEPGRAAATALAERASALGWAVSLLPAPDGRDWNDVLAGTGVAA